MALKLNRKVLRIKIKLDLLQVTLKITLDLLTKTKLLLWVSWPEQLEQQDKVLGPPKKPKPHSRVNSRQKGPPKWHTKATV